MRELPPVLDHYCTQKRMELEEKYLAAPDSEPWRQSGMSGPLDRWTYLRKPVSDCIDHDGKFLDLCCANGFFLECVQRWADERGIRIIPYGLDISSKFVELAKARLPLFTDNLFVGNCFVWEPPARMDYVSFMAGLFEKREYEDALVQFVVDRHLAPEGRLFIHCTGPSGQSERNMRNWISLDKFHQVGHRIGHDPIKNREVYVAVIMKAPSDNHKVSSPRRKR